MTIERFEIDTEQWAVVCAEAEALIDDCKIAADIHGDLGHHDNELECIRTIAVLRKLLAMLAAAPRPEAGQPACTVCHGQTGYEADELYGDQVTGRRWVDCAHCKGDGAEPQRPAPRPAPQCPVCGASTAEVCTAYGCFRLECGNGEPHPKAVQVDEMVRRFLIWKLPKDFAPDGHISFDSAAASTWPHSWPIGTNLFSAAQAKEMVLHLLENRREAPRPVPTSEQIQCTLEILTEIQYFSECTHKHRAWAWNALNALAPDIAKMAADNAESAYDYVTGLQRPAEPELECLACNGSGHAQDQSGEACTACFGNGVRPAEVKP